MILPIMRALVSSVNVSRWGSGARPLTVAEQLLDRLAPAALGVEQELSAAHHALPRSETGQHLHEPVLPGRSHCHAARLEVSSFADDERDLPHPRVDDRF